MNLNETKTNLKGQINQNKTSMQKGQRQELTPAKQNAFRYSFKPLFIKHNSTTWLTPVNNFQLKNKIISFPVFLKLHFIPQVYFPQNICLRKIKVCNYCSNKTPSTTYAVFPAEIENDIRIVFMPLKYFPSEYTDKGILIKEKYNELINKKISIELSNKNKQAIINIIENNKNTIELTEIEKKVVLRIIFPPTVFKDSKIKSKEQQ